MKRLFFIISFLFFFLNNSYSQSFIGKVIDENNSPIQYANVILINESDSLFLCGSVTNEKGEFNIPYKGNGNKRLKISYIGYVSKISHAEVDKYVTFQLTSLNAKLNEVVVIGRRKVFKMENGAIVTRVQNTLLATLSNANEVLSQLPFVNGENGNFKVFGKGTPLIYINNRLVRDENELSQLSPNDIKEIKVITTPGAEYDASVKAVIKITTIKPIGAGLSGMVYAKGTIAREFSDNEYISLNYRKGAWDILGSLDYYHSKQRQSYTGLQKFIFNEKEKRQQYSESDQWKEYSYNPVIGFNFNPSERHSLGIRYSGKISKDKDYSINDMESFDNLSTAEYIKQGILNKDNSDRHLMNAYYEGTLSNKLSVKINFDVSKGKKTNKQEIYYLNTSDSIPILAHGATNYNLYAAKGLLSYSLPKGTLSVGSEYAYTKNVQTYINEKEDLDLPETNDKALQNRTALFATYETQLKHFTFNAGLRYEIINLNYYQNEIKNKEQGQRYQKLFPNISVSYSGNRFHIQLAFESKVRYPTYNELRSNIQYSSPFLYESGNPYLKPNIKNEFTYMFSWMDFNFLASYTINKDAIFNVPQLYNDKPIILLKNENVDKYKEFNFGVSYSPSIGIWNPSWEISELKQWLNLGNPETKYNHPIFMYKWYNALEFSSKWIFRININGMTRGNEEVAMMKPSWGLNLMLSKKLFYDKLSIQLAVNDIFKTREAKWDMHFNNLQLFYDKDLDSRSIVLTLTYRFNSTKSKYKGTNATNEINRL